MTVLKADDLCQQRADRLDKTLTSLIGACTTAVQRSKREVLTLTTARKALDKEIASFVEAHMSTSHMDDSVARVASILDMVLPRSLRRRLPCHSLNR